MRHPRPRLSEYSRWLLARLVVEDGQPQARVAELFQVSRPTVSKWAARYRAEGAEGLSDRSSRPRQCPHRTASQVELLIVAERNRLRSGPDDLAARLGLAPVTVWRVLRRHGCSRLADYDRTHTIPVRYQRDRPGELLHIDIKRLGRIPEGGGWRLRGLASMTEYKDKLPPRGHDYVHVAIDDATRVAYVEVLSNQRGPSCAAFLERSNAFFGSLGVKVESNCGGARFPSGVERDLVEKRPRSCFGFTSGETANHNCDYLLDAFSDSLCGAFFCNTRTRCCPDSGIEAFPPSTISLAVILRP